VFFLRFDGASGAYSSYFDLAIGLARHQRTGSPTLLENFARQVGAKTYSDIYGAWKWEILQIGRFGKFIGLKD